MFGVTGTETGSILETSAAFHVQIPIGGNLPTRTLLYINNLEIHSRKDPARGLSRSLGQDSKL
jgi:hypothetical protein